MGRKIALKNDSSDHGGTIISSGQDGTLKVGGVEVAVQGAQHSCPQKYPDDTPHGTTSITAVTTKSYHNGKLILTNGAIAGCGAIIQPPDRNVYIE